MGNGRYCKRGPLTADRFDCIWPLPIERPSASEFLVFLIAYEELT
jgi:hypothetical protein